MKNQYIYLFLLFIFTLFFLSYITENNIYYNKIIHNEQETNEILNFFPNISANNKLNYEWYHEYFENLSVCCKAVALDSLDNIYLAGYTKSFGAGLSDFCLVKFNSEGDYQWNRTWGGVKDEICNGIIIDSSDNIYLAGYTNSFGAGNRDICLVKFDSLGVLQWNYTWGGIEHDICYGLAFDSLNNIYVSGSTMSFGMGREDFFVVRFNSMGNYQWNRTWGGTSFDIAHAITIDSSDSIYLAGYTNSFGAGNCDMCLVKFDSLGVLQWNYTWGGSANDYCYAISSDSLNNIYIGGSTWSFGGGNEDMCLVKYNDIGIMQWNHTWGGNEDDSITDLTIDSLENILVSGFIDFQGFNTGDIGVFTFNSSGAQQLNLKWGLCDEENHCEGVVIDSLNNTYLGGYIYKKGLTYTFLMKCNPEFTIPKYVKFIDSVIVSKTFTATMEYNLITRTYYDRSHNPKVIFDIVGINNSIYIGVLYDVSYITKTKIITKHKLNDSAVEYEIKPSRPSKKIKINSYSEWFFTFYMSYSYTYISCVFWGEIYCEETAIKTEEDEILSDLYDFDESYPGIQIHGYNIYLLICIIGIVSIILIKKVKYNKKNKKIL